MRKLLAIATLLLAGTAAAQAQYTFDYDGRTIRIVERFRSPASTTILLAAPNAPRARTPGRSASRLRPKPRLTPRQLPRQIPRPRPARRRRLQRPPRLPLIRQLPRRRPRQRQLRSQPTRASRPRRLRLLRRPRLHRHPRRQLCSKALHRRQGPPWRRRSAPSRSLRPLRPGRQLIPC